MDPLTRRRGDGPSGVVLILATNAEMRTVLADALRAEAIIAVPAVGVAHAAVLSQRLAPSLVIVVVADDDANAVRNFRRAGPSTPVLALCFEATGDGPHQCRVRGAEDVLCWPFPLGDVVEAVQRILSR